MNVVVVGGCLPFPPNAGNRIRTLNLLTRLARRHRLTFLASRNPDRAEAREALTYLADHGITPVEVGQTAPSKRGPRFYAQVAGNLASRLPYSVALYQGPALTRAVREVTAKERVDLWQAEWVAGMEAFRALDGARTVLTAHNVETQLWERSAAAQADPLRRWYFRGQCRKYERFERWAFHAATRVVTVSDDDAALVRNRFGVPAERVDVVDNGIDRATFESIPAETPRDPRRILFLGSLDWRPNLDAVNLLLDRIFPAVRAAEPAATLDLVGRNPPPTLVKRAAAVSGVTLHANVADVRPFLAGSAVMAVPLRVGGGSRLKILESLAAGLPVVSTRVGAEGLELAAGEDLDVVDDVEAMAPALVEALRRPARVLGMAARARAKVFDRYDWDRLADALERSWRRCLDAPTVPSRRGA